MSSSNAIVMVTWSLVLDHSLQSLFQSISFLLSPLIQIWPIKLSLSTTKQSKKCLRTSYCCRAGPGRGARTSCEEDYPTPLSVSLFQRSHGPLRESHRLCFPCRCDGFDVRIAKTGPQSGRLVKFNFYLIFEACAITILDGDENSESNNNVDLLRHVHVRREAEFWITEIHKSAL